MYFSPLNGWRNWSSELSNVMWSLTTIEKKLSKIPLCACVKSFSRVPLQLHELLPTGSSVHGILQARTLEWIAFFLLQGIFLTQRLNLGLLHCRRSLYHLRHQGSILNFLIILLKSPQLSWEVTQTIHLTFLKKKYKVTRQYFFALSHTVWIQDCGF